MTAKLNNGKKKYPSGIHHKSRGFSLFELVVFIICVAIIYAVAANRFSEFPGAAERANFLSVITQVQAGINLEALLGVSRGEMSRVSNLEGANPMDMLLQTPSNYLGAFDIVDKERLPKRSWYFDLSRGELVYLVNDADGVYFLINAAQIQTDEIRFKVEPSYRYEDKQTGRAVALEDMPERGAESGELYRRRFSGVLMQAVTPYQWDATSVDLPELAITDTPG